MNQAESDPRSSNKKFYVVLIPSLLLSFLLLRMYLEHEWDNLRIDGINETCGTVICKSAFDIMANNTYMIISRAGKVVVMNLYLGNSKADLVVLLEGSDSQSQSRC